MSLKFLLLFASLISVVSCVDYVEKYFEQKIDHFNFLSYGNQTFQQRYLYNDSWWDRENGPIFFYAGNEGDVVGFWKNTGFMFDIAPQFRALILFAEHRYYGKSLPFGKSSFESKNIGLLTIEQALADYAFFLTKFKLNFHAVKTPVIAFGGSYGGMLAAYMRFKYPNIIHGAIAASAPIYQIAGLTDGEKGFFHSVTKDFHDVSPNCEIQVRKAFFQLQAWSKMGTVGLKKISDSFNLCTDLKSNDDYNHFLRWIRNSFIIAAMTDYPYPASFMGNFPAYPVKVMCKLLLSGATPVVGLNAANSLYYNASGTVKCFDIYNEYIYCADPTGCGLGDDSKAWDYQACTEVNLEGGSNGATDMFPVLPFNSSMRDNYCLKTWNVVPRRDWIAIQYWGRNIETASNIVFSNGDLDPWAQGGVLQNITDTLVSVIVKGGAHHLDLRGHNPADPPSVLDARQIEVENIKKWLNFKKTNSVINFL